MIRKVAGYSVLAVLGVLALKLALWVLGVAFSLLMTLFWVALVGFVIYLVLRVVSPRTADWIRETVEGFGRRDFEAEEIEVDVESEPEEDEVKDEGD